MNMLLPWLLMSLLCLWLRTTMLLMGLLRCTLLWLRQGRCLPMLVLLLHMTWQPDL